MISYNSTHTITNAGGTLPLNVTTDENHLILIRGTATLLGSGYTITPSSPTPTRPCTFRIFYDGNVTYSGGNTITVFGTVLTAEQALKGHCLIEIVYDFSTTAQWRVIVTEGFDTDYEGLQVTNMNPAGDTIVLTSNSKQVQYFTSAAVPLTGNYAVNYSGTFRDGQTFFLKYAGLFTIGASTITFFGENIDSSQAALGNCTVIAWYDLGNTTFRTQLIPSPPASAAFNFSTLPVSLTGTLYPAATAGDSFRITCVSEEGRLGSAIPNLEPPLVRRVYQDDLLYCISTTAGGDTAAAGSSFFVFGAPRAMVPIGTTNGASNFRLNANNNITSPNVVGSGTNEANGLIGEGNQVSSSSKINWIVGIGHALAGTLHTIVAGQQITTVIGSSDNLLTGYLSSISGSRDVVGGTGHTIVGSDSMVTGASQTLGGASQGASMRVLMAGAGADARISNGLYLGASTSPSSFGGNGGMQQMLFPLGAVASAVSHPTISYMELSVNQFAGSQDTLLMGSNSMTWSFESRIIVAQTAVGVDHTNTSAIGDWAEYVVAGVINRSSGGAMSLSRVKWLDHRNRWVPTSTPNAIVYRNRSTTGARPDVNLIIPSVLISGTTLIIKFQFPGFAELMTDQGANATPRFAAYVANGDVNGGVPIPINTGVAGTDGVIPNTITTTLAPLTADTFRYPLVDIFDGNDANGTGYYGGAGLGATATALLKPTSVAGVGLYTGGSYNNGVTATIAFGGGNATGVCVMSANTDHIGNNVGFTAGDYTGCPNGNYPFTFSGGTGVGAAGFATIVGGIVTAATITNGGSGYTTGDVVTITIPTALPVVVPAVFTPTLYLRVVSVTIGGANNNYTNATDLTVTFAGAGLSQAIGSAYLAPTKIDGAGTITVTSGGMNYGISPPNVAVYDRGGLGFTEGNGGSFRASGNILISQLKYS